MELIYARDLGLVVTGQHFQIHCDLVQDGINNERGGVFKKKR